MSLIPAAFHSTLSKLKGKKDSDQEYRVFQQSLVEQGPEYEELALRLGTPSTWKDEEVRNRLTAEYTAIHEAGKHEHKTMSGVIGSADDPFDQEVQTNKRGVRVLDFRPYILSPEEFYRGLGELFSLTDLTKYNGFSPLEARDKIISELGLDLVNRLIAIVANNSMKKNKLTAKRTKEGLREINTVLRDIAQYGKDLDLTPGRIVSSFCDLMFMYRCALKRKGLLKETGSIDIPEPLNFLSASSLINLDAWEDETKALSTLLNKDHVASPGVLEIIRKSRPEWRKLFPDAAVALHLQHAYRIEQCGHDHNIPETTDPKWGIFAATDHPVCGTCLTDAMRAEGVAVPVGLSGRLITGT